MSCSKILRAAITLAILLLSTLPNVADAQTPDPGLPGAYPVTKLQYDLGDVAYTPPGFGYAVEVRGSVHYPTTLTPGPFPVLVFLHGRHSTCFRTSTPGTTSLTWPCPTGYESIVSYEGYDYIAQTMASHGYIVISVSCNGINARDNSLGDYGMQGRAELMQYHLNLWNTWNTTGGGPFGSLFVGKLDLQNIGTMGHSRGGEGVVYHALHNRALGSPYGIKAVLTLAPVDFNRKVLTKTALMNIAPYCDGDVSNLQGVHFYDDARYRDTTDETPKHNIVMMGANHNFFNTVWTPGSYIAGTADDWNGVYGSTDPHCGLGRPGNRRYDTGMQKKAFNAYGCAFFRTYIGHDTSFAPILNVDDIFPPVSSTLDTDAVFVSYHAGRTLRLDINRTDTITSTLKNNLSDTVTTSGLIGPALCGGGFTSPACSISTYAAREPHKGSTTTRGLMQMKLHWNDTTDWYQNDIPTSYQDFSTYRSLKFRVSENFSEITSLPNLNFSVQLIDSLGDSSAQEVANNSYALFYQPGATTSQLPKVVFNTITIPLAGFTGIDLTKVRHIKFLFNKSDTGSIVVSDISLISQKCGKLSAFFTDSNTHIGYNVLFTDNTKTNYGDTLSYLWNFGDPTSGLNDTSTLRNPNHAYTGPGTYTACLYVKSIRRNGDVCNDTFCTTITLLATTVLAKQAENRIQIIPNPAKDYLYITGSENTDILTITDIYGRQVYSATILNHTVTLPQSLGSGIYYAVIGTQSGNVYKKIVITR